MVGELFGELVGGVVGEMVGELVVDGVGLKAVTSERAYLAGRHEEGLEGE